jgi:methyl-accepting chemotaxis protein
MRMRLVLVLCGVVIFVVSSIFSAVLSFYYSINPAVIFYFLTFEAVIIFIVTTVFLGRYYDAILDEIRKSISTDMALNEDLQKEEKAVALLIAIKERQERAVKDMRIERDKIKAIISDMNGLREIYERESKRSEEIRLDIKAVSVFIETNIRTFEKIKAIGLEIKTTSKNIDSETQNVLKDAKKQSESASKGVKTIGKEIQSITEIKQSIISSASVIEELMEMSKKIKAFVLTISDMTKKTNMLALNAGIEAARAGEAGKSFSVVAEEIKNLAANSNQSAEDITQILQDIQKRTSEVIEMIQMTERIEDNIKTFYQTGDIFIAIVKDVKHVEALIGKISSYTDEHFTDSELMFKIISDFYKKSEEYTKIADRMTAEMDELDKKDFSYSSGIESIMIKLRKFTE